MSGMTILALFLILNAITCILYGIDKWKAIHGAWRIRESHTPHMDCPWRISGGFPWHASISS